MTILNGSDTVLLYERLLLRADNAGLTVKEKPLQGADGLIYGKRVAIRKDIPTATEKACVLAEELGHHYTSCGNIMDMDDINNRQQEHDARLWGYNNLIGLQGIIRAFEHGCRNRYEMAEFLEVTEEYLEEALKCYRSKYGIYKVVDNYAITFIPNLAVTRIL